MRRREESFTEGNEGIKVVGEFLKKCMLCGHRCGMDRIGGDIGVCAAGALPKVSKYFPHKGEEPPISGSNGSGTIFFSQCGMKCVYCQNHNISQKGEGEEVSDERLVEMMLELAAQGCHNINFVTPTHFATSVISAVKVARVQGLKVPIVYNTSGYDTVELIDALNGVVDVFLSDMRYASDAMAFKYSRVPNYVKTNRAAVKAMYDQVGNLTVSDDIAERGLIIRLLILPGNISGTVDALEWICGELGPDIHLSVMSQYYPAWKASEYPELSQRLNRKEYDQVVSKLDELGMEAGWLQPFEGGLTDEFAGEVILGR